MRETDLDFGDPSYLYCSNNLSSFGYHKTGDWRRRSK